MLLHFGERLCQVRAAQGNTMSYLFFNVIAFFFQEGLILIYHPTQQERNSPPLAPPLSDITSIEHPQPITSFLIKQLYTRRRVKQLPLNEHHAGRDI